MLIRRTIIAVALVAGSASPTNDQFLAEVQGHLGPRGLRIAKKGLEAANSPNKLTDEQLVVMAILTAIVRGTEVFIVTRDADVLEQYFKVLCLMKEHYRAMHVAERYAASPEAMPFREVPIHSDGVHVPEFSGSSVLELETTAAGAGALAGRPRRLDWVPGARRRPAQGPQQGDDGQYAA